MNKVILMGRLVKNPELKVTATGVSVCSFTLAVDKKFVKQGEARAADFINCVAWRAQAEFITKYFIQGQMMSMVGNLQVRNYEKDGKRVYVTEVVVDDVYFCGSKGTGNTARPSGTDNGNSYVDAAPSYDTPDEEFIPIDSEDDLPF